MNKFLLPVIHVSSQTQAEQNIIVAMENGADGVFLINHDISIKKLLEITSFLKSKYPNYWMGINCLGQFDLESICKTSENLNAFWTDNAFDLNQTQYQLLKEKKITYFGGVAFKYQPPVENLEETCKSAAEFVDVITTSGPGTGEPPEIDKIKNMKEYIGNKPLAIASGITIDNVLQFLPYVDYFLVATGISENWETLDPIKVKKIADIIKS